MINKHGHFLESSSIDKRGNLRDLCFTPHLELAAIIHDMRVKMNVIESGKGELKEKIISIELKD